MVYFDFKQTLKQLLKFKAKHSTQTLTLTPTFSIYPVSVTSRPIVCFPANFQAVTEIYKHNTKRPATECFQKNINANPKHNLTVALTLILTLNPANPKHNFTLALALTLLVTLNPSNPKQT